MKDNPPLATITKLISEAADRGAALTSSLLSFARKQALQPAEIDVNELLEELAKLLLATFDKKIEIVTRLDGNIWLAFADRGQLSSALLNLAINARDAMPEGGRLTLTTRNVVFGVREAVAVGAGYAGDYVEIEIADTGTGIPQAILDRIFDPFFSTKDVGKGTGLGLSMVFGFVKQSGGGIKVDFEEGRGTTFTIYLPKAETSTLRPTGYDERKFVGGTETILCVEDDRDVRQYVTVQLESLGYKVIPAANASRSARHRGRGHAVRSAFHRHRDGRRLEWTGARRRDGGCAALVAGAVHVGLCLRRPAWAGTRHHGRAASDKALPQGRARAHAAPLPRHRRRCRWRSDPDALFGAGRCRGLFAQAVG